MKNELKEHIEGLAAVAKPSQEQLAKLISDWDDYFAAMHVTNEDEEFHSIIRARLQSGVISLVAPTEYLLGGL